MSKFLTTVLIALALSSCVAIPDPQVLEKPTVLADSKIKPSKILVVLDIVPEYPTISAKNKDAYVDKTYGEVAKSLVKNIKDQGVDADFMIRKYTLPKLATTGFSHVLYEKLDSFINERDGGYNFAKYRVWEMKLYELDKSEKSLALSQQAYTSDGVACWRGSLYANVSTCKTNYISLLMGHLSPIGISNKAAITDKK